MEGMLSDVGNAEILVNDEFAVSCVNTSVKILVSDIGTNG
jgi:hypothetical protein